MSAGTYNRRQQTNSDTTEFVVAYIPTPKTLAELNAPPTIYGPFPSHYAAERWANDKLEMWSWEVVPLVTPVY